jgi:DNA-binding NtrC family response regulator
MACCPRLLALALRVGRRSSPDTNDAVEEGTMSRILLIDDDQHFGEHLERELAKRHYQVEYRDSAEDVIELVGGDFDLVLLDNYMPGLTGLEFLSQLRQRGLMLPVILMTGLPSADTVMDAMNLGAYGYVSKDYRHIEELLQEFIPLIRKALEIDWRGEHVQMPGDSSADDDSAPRLLGNSKAMIEVYGRIGRCVGCEVPVLIRGETGTGKELVAKAIRARARKNKPFVTVRCAAFNEDQLDDELFGHEPGAFPGADKLRKGSFEHANGGTLFLDKIGDMPLRIQEKLLSALVNREIFRRGSTEPIKVNVRLLAATKHDLEAAIAKGTFMRELVSRLSVVTIKLPTLHERGPEDLRLLVQHFLTRWARCINHPPRTLHEDAWEKLHKHTWPGNVSELQTVIDRAVVQCPGPHITAEYIKFDACPSCDGDIVAALRQAVQAALQSGQINLVPRLRELLNQELLLLALNKCGGDQEKAERLLGVPLKNLLESPNSCGTAVPAAKTGKIKAKEILQTEALLLIRDHPEWTADQYAEKLSCSKATLYRDTIINRALQSRGGGR